MAAGGESLMIRNRYNYMRDRLSGLVKRLLHCSSHGVYISHCAGSETDSPLVRYYEEVE